MEVWTAKNRVSSLLKVKMYVKINFNWFLLILEVKSETKSIKIGGAPFQFWFNAIWPCKSIDFGDLDLQINWFWLVWSIKSIEVTPPIELEGAPSIQLRGVPPPIGLEGHLQSNWRGVHPPIGLVGHPQSNWGGVPPSIGLIGDPPIQLGGGTPPFNWVLNVFYRFFSKKQV